MVMGWLVVDLALLDRVSALGYKDLAPLKAKALLTY